MITDGTVPQKPAASDAHMDVVEAENPRIKLLKDSLQVTSSDRPSVYGPFTENMDVQGMLWRIYTAHAKGKYSAAHDAAMCNVFAKLSRVCCGKLHRDNYADMINYIAAAFEAEDKAVAASLSRLGDALAGRIADERASHET